MPTTSACLVSVLVLPFMSARADLADPAADPYGNLGSAAALTPHHAIAGADARRWHDANRVAHSIGALLAWPREVSGEPSGEPIVVVPADGVRGERFGAAVASWGEVLAVGSPGYGTAFNAFDIGRVRVLDGSLAVVATIDAPPGPSGVQSASEFGSAVSILDGALVIGEPGYRPAVPGPFVGAAYLYESTPKGWTLAREMVAPTATGTRFGSATAITPDTIAVGAPGGGFGEALDHGRVWLHDRSDPAAPPVELVAPQVQLDDRFGAALAASDSVLVIGAPGCACGEGRVFVGAVTHRAWKHLATLVPPDGPGWEGFGGCVALAGPRVAVGSGGIAVDGSGLGSRLAIYLRGGDEWTLETVVAAEGGEPAFGMVQLDAAGVLGSEPLGGALGTGTLRYEPLERSADLDGNGIVDAADLSLLLGAWGPTDGVDAADLDGDGTVGAADLATLLGAWTR